jgi:hypothetical protein
MSDFRVEPAGPFKKLNNSPFEKMEVVIWHDEDPIARVELFRKPGEQVSIWPFTFLPELELNCRKAIKEYLANGK